MLLFWIYVFYIVSLTKQNKNKKHPPCQLSLANHGNQIHSTMSTKHGHIRWMGFNRGFREDGIQFFHLSRKRELVGGTIIEWNDNEYKWKVRFDSDIDNALHMQYNSVILYIDENALNFNQY